MVSTNSFLRAAVLATFFRVVQSAIYTDPSQLPRLTYDYVIVGAGTAGNVIAARLTENPNCEVLVLEAGGSDNGILASAVPLLGPSLVPNSMYDWNYTTQPQPYVNNRKIELPRGRLLGGCSSVNYLVYTRGPADDLDRYAKTVGDSGWSWDNMEVYRLRNERLVPPADGRNTAGMCNPSVHGTKGVLPVSMPNSPTPLDKLVVDAAAELQEEFHFNPDMNGGDTLGVGFVPLTTNAGRRCSSATTYLHPHMHRPNLHVLTNAQVTRVIKTGKKDGRPVFGAVEFQSDPATPRALVNAATEVILSAGTIGTPTILQLSGIGDKQDLESVGIETVADLPSVGKNLSDHLMSSVIFKVKGPTYDDIFREFELFQGALNEWEAQKTGPFTNGPTNQLGFFRLPSDHPVLQGIPDPASGPHGPHYELIFVNAFFSPGLLPPPGNFMSITGALVAPTSRGTIKLASSDPWVAPLIDPHFLSTEYDRVTLRESIKAAYRFVNATRWKDWIERPWEESATLTDDERIDGYVRRTCSTVFHPVGTAAMSPKCAKWGVLDPDLKVKGTEGLRVVDASIMPFIPSAHTQAPVYIMAERAADIIKESPGFKKTLRRRDEL
ncbi:hypothetical protein AX16_000176 [Volvariella volvacea WC 439]|nr:hypothetical protein AX16_000176 [Volvariella volvacea WC 439]